MSFCSTRSVGRSSRLASSQDLERRQSFLRLRPSLLHRERTPRTRRSTRPLSDKVSTRRRSSSTSKSRCPRRRTPGRTSTDLASPDTSTRSTLVTSGTSTTRRITSESFPACTAFAEADIPSQHRQPSAQGRARLQVRSFSFFSLNTALTLSTGSTSSTPTSSTRPRRRRTVSSRRKATTTPASCELQLQLCASL